MKRVLLFLFCLPLLADDIAFTSYPDIFDCDYYALTDDQRKVLSKVWADIQELEESEPI